MQISKKHVLEEHMHYNFHAAFVVLNRNFQLYFIESSLTGSIHLPDWFTNAGILLLTAQ